MHACTNVCAHTEHRISLSLRAECDKASARAAAEEAARREMAAAMAKTKRERDTLQINLNDAISDLSAGAYLCVSVRMCMCVNVCICTCVHVCMCVCV